MQSEVAIDIQRKAVPRVLYKLGADADFTGIIPVDAIL